MDAEIVIEIRNAVREVFTEGALVSPATHEDHHRFIQSLIKKNEACTRNRQRITAHVIGWLAVSFISGLGFLLWLGFKIVTKGAVHE